MCTLLYINQISNKDLLYSTGNYIQYLVITYNGKESERVYIHILLNHLAAHLKLTQHCKLTIFQFLKKRNTTTKNMMLQFARSMNLPVIYGIILQSVFIVQGHELASNRWDYFIICRHMYTLTMLFIFEDDEPALCFLRLLTSSTFPSFGFKIILLPPAVPSDRIAVASLQIFLHGMD